ncbi:MAG: TIGR02921 family PEP-CTERM protein [Chloroflexi bacterium]|nr:TIGR02921 family PEP-CTERM protein [Chloroflexota bacterium]
MKLTTATSFIRRVATANFWGYVLFWPWNLIFVTFLLLGFAPLVLVELLVSVAGGVVPPVFLAVGVTLVLIPLTAIALAATVLRRSPERLFALAYGVEWPLMFMLALRFFILRDATPGVTLILSLAALGNAALLWQILDRGIDARRTALLVLRAAGLTFLLLIYLYGSLWLAFYAVPLGVGLVRVAGEVLGSFWRYLTMFNWRDLLIVGYSIVFSMTGGVLFLFSATLFVITPIAVPILAIRSWHRALAALGARVGLARAMGFTAAVALVCAGLAVWTNQQSQPTAFALLKNPPKTLAEAQAIARQEETVRAGLVNSYLAPFRYISAVGEVNHIAELYRSVVGFSREQAAAVEALYEALMRPLLYEPATPPDPATLTQATSRPDGRALREEPAQAAKLYKQYFDERIVDGEHAAVAAANTATWQGTQAEAALKDVDDREVHLDRQEITITEHGDWAEVELYEVYQNQTLQRQEVVYYFSLSESAVVTGVWLGNSDNRNTRFAYRVAPRGAAQATYRHEVRRNVDPALVEQIGPRQYRLRVFPIEPRRWTRSGFPGQAPATEDAPRMYMWLTYNVLAKENAWPLPLLAEKRSVYWDSATARVINGKPASDPNAWLAEAVPATAPVSHASHRFEFASGETVVAQPLAASDLPKLPANLRLAVVLDRSRSMRLVAAEVKSALARLNGVTNADVYLTASPYRGEPPSRVKLNALDVDRLDYIGGQNVSELLAQYESLRAGAEYGAIIVLTDGSGYELGESSVKAPVLSTPVWMVHLGNRLPLGYDDSTLEAIQASGGSVTNSVQDALNRIAFALDRGANATADWVDGYTWVVTPGTPRAQAGETAFAAFAARRVILNGMYRERANLRQLSTLDQLHALALKHSIVTPFSSMLVLVNTQQEQLLKELEQRGDRFEREVEGVGDTQGQNALQVTGVPEPHEWLLIGLAVAMLAAYAFRKRRLQAAAS